MIFLNYLSGVFMQENELKELIDKILERKIETSNIEFKSAKEGYPEKIYDSLKIFI